jgi:hypothetical protein
MAGLAPAISLVEASTCADRGTETIGAHDIVVRLFAERPQRKIRASVASTI